jgi:hypothetical protein
MAQKRKQSVFTTRFLAFDKKAKRLIGALLHHGTNRLQLQRFWKTLGISNSDNFYVWGWIY